MSYSGEDGVEMKQDTFCPISVFCCKSVTKICICQKKTVLLHRNYQIERIMSSVQIEGLWSYIQTLALSNYNKRWLAERLVESATNNADGGKKETDYILSSDAMRQIIEEGDQQLAAGQGIPTKVEDLWK